MGKKIFVSEAAPAPVGPYSQAVEANGFIFFSGQIPLSAAGEMCLGSVSEQAEIVLANIGAVLKTAELDFEDIVKTMVYLTDMADFTDVNNVYERFFSKGLPARSCVAVSQLPKGASVEIEVIACRSN